MPSRPVFAPTYKNRIADAGGFAEKDLILAHQAERERVHQRIERIGIVECDFAADGRHAKRIAVVRDARDHSGQQRSISSPVLRMIERAKSQAVHRSDRPRAHREDVAQDSADTSGRALKRFDEGRMIVRLDLESRAPAVTEINDAGVFTRAAQSRVHPWSASVCR